MAFCARCGHDLADSPSCGRCGTPAVRLAGPGAAAHTSSGLALSDTGDTAERPAVLVAPQPVVVPPPSREPAPSTSRFPLYADELDARRPPGRHSSARPLVAPEPVAGQDRSVGDLLPWVVLGVAALGLLLVAAVWLLFRPGDQDEASGSVTQRSGAQPEPAPPSEAADPAKDGSARSGVRVRDVAASATALVPATAPPNADVDGRPVSYGAAQMFDGDATTAWRMAGDGTDALITIRLAKATEVRRVGMVNGYAKEAVDRQGRTVRWYLRNRRITRVSWSFDDGSVVRQDLAQRPRMQTVRVGAEATRTIRLRLIEVTEPMRGPLGRDFTAISELLIAGVTIR